MKTTWVRVVGAITLGIFVGSASAMAGSLDHMIIVPAPAGFEKVVDNTRAIHWEGRRSIHHVAEPVITPEAPGQVAAEVAAEKPVESTCRPTDTSRAVLDKEAQWFQRPMPNTNVFGNW